MLRHQSPFQKLIFGTLIFKSVVDFCNGAHQSNFHKNKINKIHICWKVSQKVVRDISIHILNHDEKMIMTCEMEMDL